MRKVAIITILALLSVSYCEGQIQKSLNDQKERNAAQQAEQKKQEAARQASIQEENNRRNRLYQDLLRSAETNVEQQQYEQAKQDYKKAIELKPENTASLNQTIREIDRKIQEIAAEKEKEKAAAEKAAEEQKQREFNQRYENTIETANRNFNQRKYAEAIQNYEAALKLKPENAYFINPKITEIERKMSEPATLYIYRKGGFLATSHRYNIFLDNKVVCQSENRLKKIVTVTTFGTKTISATIENRKAEVQINFEPGGVYYVQSSVKSDTRNTGQTKQVTSTVYKSEGSIFKGTYKSTPAGTKTETVPVTEIYYTPILQLMDKSVGEAEYDAIKDKN